jgi:ribosomal protein L11 methyltransferase
MTVNTEPKNTYFRVSIFVEPEVWEAVCNYCFEIGATGIEEQADALSIYFPGSEAIERSIDLLQNYLASLRGLGILRDPVAIRCEELETVDWNAQWRKGLKEIRISDNILVKPTWRKNPVPAPPVIIDIDPQMAFGTGVHATTRLTLQALEKVRRPGFRALDVGTGTGILAIAAAKLGWKAIVAFDIDPVAALTARTNIRHNGVNDKIAVFSGTMSALRDIRFDLIMANVNRTQILKLLPLIKELLDYNGILIISGILDTEEKIIRTALLDKDFFIDQMSNMGEWLVFTVRG